MAQIDQKLIDRINFLANKSKNEGLTVKELNEQKELRKQYITLFREGFKQRLESIEWVDNDNKSE